MDFDIEMGDAAQGMHDMPSEEPPPADDILVPNPRFLPITFVF